MESRDSFLDHRKRMESAHIERIKTSKNPIDAILTIEINTTELCNRKCVFCPRVDSSVYPNQPLHMTPYVAQRIAETIKRENYSGRISFSGYGENLMNRDFDSIVTQFRRILGPTNIIECNTNGDFLAPGPIDDLFSAGLDYLYINMYDSEVQEQKFIDMFEQAGISKDRWKLRAHWDNADYGLYINNRSGMLKGYEDDIKVTQQCFYPFYKMMVDYNGNVLFCSNDWGRERIVGNLLHHSLKQVWLSEEMDKIRRNLYAGNRDITPCDKCSVNGTLIGHQSADLYFRSSNL